VIEAGATVAIHPGALGDVLLAVPALRALRAQRPGSPLVLAAQPRLGRLLESLGEVQGAVDFESLGLGALFTEEPGGGPPLLVHAGRVVCWFGSREPLFGANLRAVAPGAQVASPAAHDVPVWQHLRRTVGAPLEGDTAPVRVPPPLAEAGRRALRGAGWDGARPVLVLHPGAGSAAKRWPVDGFAAVARALGRTRALALAVHEGPADAAAASGLVAALGPEALRLREPSPVVLAGALAAAVLHLGNDSGVSHLAAMVGTPSVVLFTEALQGWRPWAPGARVCVVAAGALAAADVEAVMAAARAAMA
jgi:ADP-heptose:LPS heptosyltransferase